MKTVIANTLFLLLLIAPLALFSQEKRPDQNQTKDQGGMVEFGGRSTWGDVYGRPDLPFQPSLKTSKYNEYRDVRDGFFLPKVRLSMDDIAGSKYFLDVQSNNAIYRDQCSACHGIEGKGVARLFPSVAGSSMVRSNDPTTAIRIVLRGARSVGTRAEPTAPGMPSYGWQLDDGQVAAVLNYIRNSWGGAAPAIDAKDVSRVRSDTALRPD